MPALQDSAPPSPLIIDSRERADPNNTPPSSYTFLMTDPSRPRALTREDQDPIEKQDRFAHTRTKRKRTSPEDLAILEAQYQVSSKPDRSTRNAIAKRVSLSEKEIQIWFQNRRQMARRKRNTWQPNEITSIIRSSQDSAEGSKSPDVLQSQQSTISETVGATPQLSSPGHKDIALPEEGESATNEQGSLDVERESTKRSTSIAGQDKDERVTIAEEEEGDIDTTNVSLQAANQIHDPSKAILVDTSNKAGIAGAAQPQRATGTPRKLKRTSSEVRLHMSLDGKVSAILCGNTPSPENKKPSSDKIDRQGLQRSQSLLPVNNRPVLSGNTIPAPPIPRIPRRSQDPRTWEFYCDSDVRESLTKTAEHEQRGSAAGAIQLIRSSSTGRRPLTAAPGNNRNIRPQLQRQSSQKRKSEADSEGPRKKFGRTLSSFARLEDPKYTIRNDDLLKAKSSSQPTLWKDPSSDSDKENRDPDGQRSTTLSRPSGKASIAGPRRKVLQESNTIPSHSTSFGAMMDKEKKQSKTPGKRARKAESMDKEEKAVDPEVADFMAGGTEDREEQDLDAVQNLLSLSQGAWA